MVVAPDAKARLSQRAVNKKLSQIFRMHGMVVRPDAMKPIYDAIQDDDDWEATLQALLAELQQLKRARPTPNNPTHPRARQCVHAPPH